MVISYTPSQLVPRILVVDDVEPDRRLLAEFLRRHGYRLFLAENGRDAVEKARFVLPDLILMDINMPECDGIAACRRLKADPATAGIPLIFLTAAAMPQERVRGLSEGAVDYVTKPFDFDEVRLRVGIHLDAARRPAGACVPAAGPAPAAPVPAAAEAPPRPASVEEVVFRAAQRLLLEHLDQTPQLAELARAVGTNARRLNEAFRKCCGATVFDYLYEARMQEARRLLAETALEVQTIAADLGYGSTSNFSTAFRERFGLSPRQYRKAPEPGA
jgi:CheY-like chemotaxis protein